MSLVAVQPGAERVRMNGSKPWITLSTGLFKQRGPPLHQATTKDTETHQEYAPWRKKLYGSKMTSQNGWCNKTSQICGIWRLATLAFLAHRQGFARLELTDAKRNAIVGPKCINMPYLSKIYIKCINVMWLMWIVCGRFWPQFLMLAWCKTISSFLQASPVGEFIGAAW